MKRSNNKQKEMTAALYVRLSRDDNLEGDSYSIGNQKKLLTKIAKEKGYTNLLDILRRRYFGRYNGQNVPDIKL